MASKANAPELRRAVIRTAQAMSAMGLSPQRSGNVSARLPGGMLITPTGMAYDRLEPEDIVVVRDDGAVAPGQRKPSSEAPVHRAIYRAFPAAGAIVHCHSMAATALACAGRDIPAFHYMVAVAGGRTIPLAAYATFGSDGLAANTVTALRGGHRACLLAHHGQVAFGADLEAALTLAAEVETLARQYLDVLAIAPKPAIIGDAEMDRVLEKFRGYGQQE